MRLSCCIVVISFALVSSVLAQNPQTITGSGCVSTEVTGKATVAFQISGSWSGTIQPSASISGQTPVNLQVTPSSSTTPQNTITANGAFFTNVAGYSTFSLCGNTVTGTANIFVNTSRYAH